MQSSIWKLLTAVGIIGIGTFVVLEAQNRIAQSRSWNKNAEMASAGVETSVTPSADTEFDRLIGSEPSVSEPEEYDKPGTGIGFPAPPAADEKFVGVIDQKVNKEDLTEGGNPFAMDEPAVAEEPEFALNEHPAEPTPESKQPEPKPEAVTAFATEETASSSPTVQPASFQPEPAPKTVETTSVATAAATSEKTKPSDGSNIEKTKTANHSGSKYTFFGNDKPGDKTASGQNATPTSEKTASETKSAAATEPKKQASRIPVKEAASPTSGVILASGTQDEPMLTVPAPVPDVSRPASSGAATDEPAFERSPFEVDTPAPIERNERGRSTTSPAVDESVPSFPPFEPEPAPTPSPASNPRTPAPRTSPATPRSETPLIDDPFPLDDATGRDERPSDSRPGPVGAGDRDDSFPTPSFPDRSSGSPFDEPLDGDTPSRLPSEGRDRGSDEPFEMDEDDRGTDAPTDDSDVRPLPSADDIPLPNDRPRSRPDTGARNDRTAATQTDVLRPQLSIQKNAPNTATVGVSHKYTIVVANDGQATAYDVVVEDQLGSEATLVDSRPVAEYDRQEEKLSWQIPELAPGQKREIVVTIKPTGEGTLDGVATVGFKAQVKSETIITAPKVELEVSGPVDAKVGSEVPLQFRIRNRGTSDATNVILRSLLPPALQHSEGADLEYEIDVLRSGDEEIVDLVVVAAEPGERVLVSAEITSNGASLGKGKTEIEVVGAQLTLERRGPERRFVGRSALYQNVVSNQSRFEAINATVVEEIPEGTRFISASNGGNYNAQNRRVTWTIPRLQAGKQIALEIELVTEEAGEAEAIVEVVEEAGFRTPLTQNTMVTVEDLHNVTADISRIDGPVAVGEQFGFTVTIENRGTAVARNVMMSIQVPLEIKVLAAGTRSIKGNLFAGNLVKYDTVEEIQPNEKVTFQIKLQGQKPSRNAPVKASLTYDEMPEPLVVSESVTIFDDRP